MEEEQSQSQEVTTYVDKFDEQLAWFEKHLPENPALRVTIKGIAFTVFLVATVATAYYAYTGLIYPLNTGQHFPNVWKGRGVIIAENQIPKGILSAIVAYMSYRVWRGPRTITYPVDPNPPRDES